MRQLPLYSKIRRRRLSPESKLQMVVCEHLRLRGVDGLLYFHPCNEGKRSEIEGLRLKRMGMLPGISDLVIDIPGKPLAFLELKSPDSKQSPEQMAFGIFAHETGRWYAVANNINDALYILEGWGCFQKRREGIAA